VSWKTKRVMVKDEDVCLHCGLCASAGPTGAWDMQKFLLDITHCRRDGLRGKTRHSKKEGRIERIEAVNDFVGEVSPTSMAPAAASGTSSFRQELPAHGLPGQPAQHFPSTSSGLPTWYEVAGDGEGPMWTARRGRPT